MSRHVHADLMIAYAKDTSLKFEVYDSIGEEWYDCKEVIFAPAKVYRIKPKPDYYITTNACAHNPHTKTTVTVLVTLTFDGQTNLVKSVELMK